MREQQLGGTALCSTLLLQQPHQQMLISNVLMLHLLGFFCGESHRAFALLG